MRPFKQLLRYALGSPLLKKKFGGLATDIAGFKDFSVKIPLTTLEELVAEKMSSGDPYSSRLCENGAALVTLQLEYDTETRLYIALSRQDLKRYAEALRRCWSLLGLRKGDGVAIFDYGTSPVSYLASSAFTPYLSQGAADALGCLPICNDGVANMSQRAVEILKFMRPQALFIRSDCLEPFSMESERQLGRLSGYTRALVVTENEGCLPKVEQDAYEKRLGLPVYRLLRIDAGMFLAMECPECRLFHSWKDLYYVESVTRAGDDVDEGGQNYLAITNWFARACPAVRYLSQVKGSVYSAGCRRGPVDIRIAA
jgi:phenylacetate-coenzyme A ligase PaaK-like adenylate-forming protein